MTDRMTEALRRLVEAVDRLGRHRQCPICLYIEHRPDCALEQARAALAATSHTDKQAPPDAAHPIWPDIIKEEPSLTLTQGKIGWQASSTAINEAERTA